MTLRIATNVSEAGTTIRLIGRMRKEHVELVLAEIRGSRAPIVLDLDEVTLADIEMVRFLAAAERQGMVLRNCAPYIREWMTREPT